MQKLLELASTWLEMHSIFKMLPCWPKGAPIEKSISLGCHLPASIVNVNHIRFSFKQQEHKIGPLVDADSSSQHSLQSSWNLGRDSNFNDGISNEAPAEITFKWVSKYSSRAIYVMQAGTSWNVCANNAIYTCLLQVWSHSDSLHLKYITMFVSQYDSTLNNMTLTTWLKWWSMSRLHENVSLWRKR